MKHRPLTERKQMRDNAEAQQNNTTHNLLARRLYLLLGWFFFGLGAVGAVVPGLPTTLFMLFALWAFSKSSQRFHDWLYAHPTFGPPLQQWRNYRVIPLKAKLLAVTMMALSFTYLCFFTTINAWILLLIALIMLYGSAFILSKPSRAPDSASPR
jgi:uncharacterized membrane protein YbaN (DUF454 family)